MRVSALFIVSLVFHAVLGFIISGISKPAEKQRSIVAVVQQEKKKEKEKQEDKKPVKVEEQVITKQRIITKAAPEAPPSTAPPTAAQVPSFGLSMSAMSVGGGGESGGINVGVGNSNGAISEAGSGSKASNLAPSDKPVDKTFGKSNSVSDSVNANNEKTIPPIAKSRPLGVYTDDARSAGIEGKVCAELIIDEAGNVSSVKLIKKMGYGLDEAAQVSFKRWKFEPAKQGGRAISFTISSACQVFELTE
jgi:periplasmic protein TonB